MRTIPELKEGTHRAKATGTLPNGKPVVVNADGTVSVISGQDQDLGSSVVFEAARARYISSVFDSNSNKVVVVYQDQDNTSAGTAIVGTVSGTSISFGSPTTFTGDASYISATFDSNSNKVVAFYGDANNSGYGTAIVGTVSGTSISFGTAVVFQSGSINSTSSTFDSANNKVVAAYRNDGASARGTAVVGTVSGTSISFGSSVQFNTSATNYTSSVFGSNVNKVVITYSNAGNSNYGTAIVGTVSGTSISFGTSVVFNAASTEGAALVFDSNVNKVVMGYPDTSNSSYATAIVGTVSGTSISFGSPSVIFEDLSDKMSGAFDSSTSQVVFAIYDNGSSSSGVVVVAKISGTSISASTPATFFTGRVNYPSPVYDSNAEKTVISYYTEDGSPAYGYSVVLQAGSTTLTSENYIGMSQGGSVASGSSATVDIIGSLSTNQSGLTAGQQYYVQTDGTIGETAADPSVFAGTAISATSLVVKT
jgi:hypothetical protein